MKGVLFNVVESVVTDVLSDDAWDDALEQAGASGAYTSLGNYDDAELVGIVGAVADIADLSVDETLRVAGRAGFAELAAREAGLLRDYRDWRSVIVALDDIIHPEVLKLYPGAELPEFSVVEDDVDLVVDYSSARGLCSLADGLIVGCGEFYDATVRVVHETCVHRGDRSCRLRLVEET